MSHEWYLYVAILLASTLAGFINTLAGSGSLITLSLLMFLGLPANVANGSNRLGVLFQSVVGVATFHKNKQIDLLKSTWFVVPMVVGASTGAMVAASLSAKVMEQVIGVIMVLMLFVILFKPEEWLREKTEKTDYKTALNILIFSAVGFYGGFIMAGVGVLILAAMVLRAKYSLKEANAVKLLTVFLFTIPVFLIYVFNQQVDWFFGTFMAIGQAFGAWLAANFAIKSPAAKIWTHRLLILIVVSSIFKILGIWDFLQNYLL